MGCNENEEQQTNLRNNVNYLVSEALHFDKYDITYNCYNVEGFNEDPKV